MIRSLVGAAAGAAAWGFFQTVLPILPQWLTFGVALAAFVIGPGAVVFWPVAPSIPLIPRIALAAGFGLAASSALAHGLSLAGLIGLYPYVAAAMTGAAIGCWTRASRVPVPRGTLTATVFLLILTGAMAALAYGHRIERRAGLTAYFGDYDAYDLTYYAAITAELSHTIPPASPFRAGHELDHSFYPQIVPAMIHRFAAVPILEIYFQDLWPVLLPLATLLCFFFVDSIASPAAALTAATLFAVGSDLSFLAKWVYSAVRPLSPEWDNVIWSANFLSPSAENLVFNNWTPTLCVVFAALYALAAHERDGRRWWMGAAGAGIAASVLFKPFPFGLLMAGLAATLLVSWRDAAVRRRLLLVGAVALAVALPYVYRVVTLIDDAQVTLTFDMFVLPRIMLRRLDLLGPLTRWARSLGATGKAEIALVGLVATPLFLVAGLGFRLAGLPSMWRALVRRADERPIWRVLAWTILAGMLVPFVVVTDPPYETMHIYQLTLFLLPIFVGRTVGDLERPRMRSVIAVALVLISVPSTGNFLYRRWAERSKPYQVVLDTELPVVAALRAADPETTVLLHNRPTRDDLIGVLAERHSVLSWGNYVRGSEGVRHDIEVSFYQSDTKPPDEAFAVLRRYRPTHVLVRPRYDSVNPAVLAALEPLVVNEDLALYAVPRTLVSGGTTHP